EFQAVGEHVELLVVLVLQDVLRPRYSIAFGTTVDPVELVYFREAHGGDRHQPAVRYDRQKIQKQPETNDQKAGTREIDDREEDKDQVRHCEQQELWHNLENDEK